MRIELSLVVLDSVSEIIDENFHGVGAAGSLQGSNSSSSVI